MILVTGGAGFIGSHVNLALNEAGYETVILDNLSRGSKKAVLKGTFIHGDLSDKGELDRLFNRYPIKTVMHFAALTDVGESVRKPELYFKNNTEGTLNLLESMRRANVTRFIFSSTAAVYGIPLQEFLREDHPLKPINPYGESKLLVEKALENLSKTTPLTYVSLRYFNAAGGDPAGRLKNHKTHENNLIPLLLRSLREGRELTVFGADWPTPDGTCLRDYIHVQDLACAHLLALNCEKSSVFNLGNGRGFSVKEVIEAAEKALRRKIPYKIGPRRAGDPPRLVADSQKAQKELLWKPRFTELEKIIVDAERALI